MSKLVPVLVFGALAFAAAAQPRAASAADLSGYGDPPPYAHPSGYDGEEGWDRRRDFGPGERRYGEDDRGPRPRVAYDERDPDRRFDERRSHGGDRFRGDDEGYEVPRRPYGGPGPFAGPGPYGSPGIYGGPGPWGGPGPYGGPYRPISAPLPFAGRSGYPDAGCVIERTESVTPVGWHKTVTHRTCYHR